jgi:hypothetical protein
VDFILLTSCSNPTWDYRDLYYPELKERALLIIIKVRILLLTWTRPSWAENLSSKYYITGTVDRKMVSIYSYIFLTCIIQFTDKLIGPAFSFSTCTAEDRTLTVWNYHEWNWAGWLLCTNIAWYHPVCCRVCRTVWSLCGWRQLK